MGSKYKRITRYRDHAVTSTSIKTTVGEIELLMFSKRARVSFVLEDVTDSRPHIFQGSLPILVIIQHLKCFSSMLCIQEAVQIFRQYVIPACMV